MERAGAAVVVEDAALAAQAIAELCRELLGDTERLQTMSAASRSLARPDAAARIAAEILATVKQ